MITKVNREVPFLLERSAVSLGEKCRFSFDVCANVARLKTFTGFFT